MSQCDPYRELELYLEQVENEISQVFENGALEFNHKETTRTVNNEISGNENKKSNDWELEPFLIEFNDTIQSDLIELLSRNNFQDIYNFHYNKIDEEDIIQIPNCNELYNVTDLEDNDTVDSFYSDSLVNSTNLNPINAATQTSSSLSPSSTNLTWESECSSSPCLTSASDSDLIDDDTQSISSIDGRENLLISLADSKHQWQQILSSKSSSAPVLKKIPIKVNKQARSQSDQHLAEIEAAEACKWLRATGFPQYAQMYEDTQFPIDITTAVQDHPLLDTDVLNSLFRRLQILNNCAHLHQQRGVTHTDESEDEFCAALSDNWTYQTDIRRWSRTCKNTQLPNLDEKNKRVNDEPTTEKDSNLSDKLNTDSPKERLRRAGSTKFRRRRDGILLSDSSNSKLLDSLSQQLDLKNASDSECSPKHRRSRTKSFDKTEPWFPSQTTNQSVLLYKLPQEDNQLEITKSLTVENIGPSLASLSCTQLQVLRKLALLKLTAHMEKYCPPHRTGWNWDLSKFIRKIKTPAYKDKNVFGVPLTITLQRTGQTLPKNIEEALLWLQQNAINHVGIFRKPGVKSRIQALRNIVENHTDILSYNDQQCYDVADMIKQYFRELPEVLLTNKLSETFILIFQYVPIHLRHESIICAILLMPDEHIQVLQALLNFLTSISQNHSINQMNESNLATCFAPSLFHYSEISSKQNLGTPHPMELMENKAAHGCLLYFLKNNHHLFNVSKVLINQCKSGEFKETKAVKLSELGKEMGGWKEYLNECQTALLKEAKERGRGWIIVSGHNQKIEISYKKVADGYPLRLWKISAEIEAPPSEVLNRILRERHIWDTELHFAKIICQIDKNCEIFQYGRKNIMSLPSEEYCVLRTWKVDLPKDACLIIETSIEQSDIIPIPNAIRGTVLASRYMIEPCGSGRSRLLHLSRVEVMGKTLEWYQKNYGHICALFIANIQNSFYQTTTGPESKV